MLTRITLLFIFLYQPLKVTGLFSWLQASSWFQTSSSWSKTLIGSKSCLMVEVIVIVLKFDHLFAIILGFARQLFSIV